MMKKLIAVIVGSIIAGMMGAYVAEASFANPLVSVLELMGSKSYACDIQRDPTCCQPQSGILHCDKNGYNALRDSCGNNKGSCAAGTSCFERSAGQAYCDTSPTCDSNAPLYGCIDSRTATNNCGKTQACASGYECRTWAGCVPASDQEFWFCGNKSSVDGQFYGRYSNRGSDQLCPGGCNPDANSDGNQIDAVCKPGGCPYAAQQYWRCDGNRILNGCNEVVRDCTGEGLTCDGNASSCKCIGDPDHPKKPELTPTQLRVTKTANKANKAFIKNGDLVTYTITLYNDGPGTLVSSRLTDQIPKGMKFVSSNRDHNIIDRNGRPVVQRGGTTAAGVYYPGEYYRFREVLPDGRWYYVGDYDGDGPTNQIICTTLTQDIGSNKQGDYVCYKENTNNWWSDGSVQKPGSNLSLEPQIWFGDSDYGRWDRVGATRLKAWELGQVIPGDLIEWYWGDIAPYTSRSVTLTLQYDGSLPNGTCIDNIARGGMDNIEEPANHTNDRGVHTVCVGQDELVADVQIQKSISTGEFENATGTAITWTLSYRNNGPNAAENVVIVDTKPDHIKFVSFSPNICQLKQYQGNELPKYLEYECNIGTLMPGAGGTITVQSSYVGDAPDGRDITNRVEIKTSTKETTKGNNYSGATTRPKGKPCEIGELCCLDGMIPVDKDGDGVNDSCEEFPVVSCDAARIVATVPTNTGARIDYQCDTRNATTVQFQVLSGSTVVATYTGASGSLYLPAGTYRGQCVVDGTINYGVASFRSNNTVTCAYKRHRVNINDWCAVQSNTPPLTSDPLDFNNLVAMAGPMPYCTQTQLDSADDYMCMDLPANRQILIQKPDACVLSGSIVVPVWARIGDWVWHDVNKNGIQDAGEQGIANSTVSLYRCEGGLTELIRTTTTSSTGYYLFDLLTGGQSYQIRFGLPTGYDTFTYKNAVKSTVSNDSNVGATNGATECIALAPGESNLTIDAGVYKNECSTCGGNDVCGNGVVETGEQCDDGNSVNGDGCNNVCQRETTCTRCGGNGGGGGSGGGIKTGNIVKNPKGGFVDPPDVMIGEYLPFWWGFDKADHVEFVPSCNLEYNPNKLYVLNSYGDDKAAVCEFVIRNGKGEESNVVRAHCDQRRNLLGRPLFKSYFAGVSDTVLRNYNGANGASFIYSGSWYKKNTTQLFDYLGEYKLVWNKTQFYTCEPEFGTGTRWEEDTNGNRVETTYTTFVRYNISPKYESDLESSMNFTVTRPYMTQQNGLSASREDADIMKKIITIQGQQVYTGTATTTTNTSYKGSDNLVYLANSFVQKYQNLARVDVSNVGGLMANSIKKVSNADIYVISNGSVLTDNGNLGRKTIIVPQGDLTVRGDIVSNIMVIVPNGRVKFEPTSFADSASSLRNQSVKGIYVAKDIVSDVYHNKNLNKNWIFGGGLKINGLIVSLSENVDTLSNLKNARRSVLQGWFTKNKKTLVQDSASLQMQTAPDTWLNLPPGANELMQELQTFR